MGRLGFLGLDGVFGFGWFVWVLWLVVFACGGWFVSVFEGWVCGLLFGFRLVLF